MNQSFSVTFSNPSSSSSEKLLTIEQEGWEVFMGTVTAANMIRYIRQLMFGEAEDVYVDCGLDGDGNVVTVVHVYPLRKDVGYRLMTSYGNLSHTPTITDDYKEQIIEFTNSDEASLTYPCFGVAEREWLGTVYDADDNPIRDPAITYEGRTLSLPQKVHGTVKLKYKMYRKSYSLTIEPREDETESAFSAAVYAVYDGGIEWLVLSTPPGAEDVNAGGTCGKGGWTNFQVAPDDLPFHPAGDFNKYIEIDYCNQVVSEERTS